MDSNENVHGMYFHVHSMEHVTMYFHEIGSAFHVLDDSGGGVDV